MFYEATRRHIYTQVLLKQYVCFFIYTLYILVYIKHNAYPAIEVKRQTPTLLQSYWLTDFYTLFQRNSTFLIKVLEKSTAVII